jgi:glycosyltransferase involved in cell wall biosynthesis
MHIVIDLQGAQAASRNRGIGRYSEAIALAFSRIARPRHRVTLLLNGAFSDTIAPIHAAFAALPTPPEIQIWHPLTPSHACDPRNEWRRGASELLYEGVLRNLAPDVVLVASLFEGAGDDAVVSIKRGPGMPPTAVVLYDLIPLISPEIYFEDASISAWYHNRLAHLRRADLLLAISASSRQEALDHLGVPQSRAVNISSAIDARFRPLTLPQVQATDLLAKYSLTHPFVMYTGGLDHRKNVEGLIAAYAALPQDLRALHQLSVVCDIGEHDRKRLLALAARKGLAENELVFTGFVPDVDLVALYNLCALFIFPSWHEGFGLPVLEAMACGAPTIAANSSSLPEVMGWDEALFDPLDPASITRALHRGLTDQSFRAALKRHGSAQSKKFSWEETAHRTLTALEALNAEKRTATPGAPDALCARRPRLAYVSPLQGALSGIADYSAELLPELAAHYDIDVILQQDEPVTDPWVRGNAQQRTVDWFEAHAQSYDRILYHFGNSPFHQHMLGLIERHPGVVVLHDFFLSGVRGERVCAGNEARIWDRTLLHAHGWEALRARRISDHRDDVLDAYPCNLEVIQRALGVIVHSPFSRRLAADWYGEGFADDWASIPHLCVPTAQADRGRARANLRLSDDVFLVCAFGKLHETKLNHRLIEVWQASALGRDPRCLLVFVGRAPDGEYGDEIRALVRASCGRIQVTGRADESTYKSYLAAADLAVQLRTLSRDETLAPVLDCMNYGLPTVVDANGGMADLPRDALEMLPYAFINEEMTRSLERLYADRDLRQKLAERARAHILVHHRPQACAARYCESIERFYAKAEQGPLGLVKAASRLGQPEDPLDMLRFAERVAEIYPVRRPAYRQLLVDVSELSNNDAKTGIQRVVRSVLHQLLEHPPKGFRVEPIYATIEHGYRYARRFTSRFLELGDASLVDEPVAVAAEDVFWGLDLQPLIVPRHSRDLQEWRLRGVKVFFTVYDLLPLVLPEGFAVGANSAHRQWMNTLAHADGLIAISKTVMDDVAKWLDVFGPQQGHRVKLGWATLGADVIKPVDGQAPNTLAQQHQIAAIRRSPAFLTVGTVEPRKGNAQVLAAFELLWSQGVHANLVIVGKLGWKTEEFAQKLRNHPLRERHLFWLEGISDRCLEEVYAASTCLIAASTNEGFGLPLVEAAMHGLPILARDIPVFREVGGKYASYFEGFAPRDLAMAVKDWLTVKAKGKVPQSTSMPWLTWAQSTRGMLDVLLHDKWQSEWAPQKDETLVARYWGSDDRLGSLTGKCEGTARVSTGQAGYLVFGPYLPLKPGSYVAELRGGVGPVGAARASADVSLDDGKRTLAEAWLGGAEPETGMLARLPFVLSKACNRLEVRVLVDEHSDLYVEEIVIRHTTALVAAGHAPAGDNAPASSVPPGFRYWATHPKLHSAVGIAVGRRVYSTAKEGFLIYGPYVGLPAGKYEALIRGVVGSDTVSSSAFADVSRAGTITFANTKIIPNDKDATVLVRLAFELSSFARDVEVRLYVGAADDVQIDSLEIVDVTQQTISGKKTLSYAF